MNKKVLTLCAGFLLAGGMFSTVDAKLATAKPTIGAKVLMGTQLSGSQMAGLVTGLEGLNPSLVDVTTFGAEWTLVQAKNADGTDKTNEFYLQNADGKYLADGGSGKNDDYRAILVDKSEDAAVFTLESNKYIKIVAGNGNDSGSWTSGVSAFYLGVGSYGETGSGITGLRAVGGKDNSTIDSYATISAVTTFNTRDLITEIKSLFKF